MSNETTLIVRGRLTEDPMLRFTPSGAGVVNFTIACQASKFDKNTSQWVDQPTKFWRCASWNQGKLTRAENVANLLKKGDSVIAFGELTLREYEKDGEKRVAEEIRVESIGKDLTFHAQPYAGNEKPAQQPANGGWGDPAPAQQAQNWGSQPSGNSGGWSSGEPAF